MVEEPGGKVDTGAVFSLRRLFPGEEPGEMLQLLQGNNTDLRWSREQPRPPVGPLRGIVTLP